MVEWVKKKDTIHDHQIEEEKERWRQKQAHQAGTGLASRFQWWLATRRE